jgi:hypothetical protein
VSSVAEEHWNIGKPHADEPVAAETVEANAAAPLW